MEDWEKQEQIRKELKDFYYEKLQFCGCGRPEYTLIFVKDLLNAIKTKVDDCENKDWHENHTKYYDKHQINLKNIFEFEDKVELSERQDGVIQFVLYYLDSIGVLEHGGSIGGAWLSDYGKEILKDLNECEDLELLFA